MGKFSQLLALSIIIPFLIGPLLLAFEKKKWDEIPYVQFFMVLCQTKGLQKKCEVISKLSLLVLKSHPKDPLHFLPLP